MDADYKKKLGFCICSIRFFHNRPSRKVWCGEKKNDRKR